MHKANQLLPLSERQFVQHDEDYSVDEIIVNVNQCDNQLNEQDQTVQIVLAKCLRLISAHKQLKYHLNVSFNCI